MTKVEEMMRRARERWEQGHVKPIDEPKQQEKHEITPSEDAEYRRLTSLLKSAWIQGQEASERFGNMLNETVRFIMQRDGESIEHALKTIAAELADLKGFSSKNLKRYLDESNRNLIRQLTRESVHSEIPNNPTEESEIEDVQDERSESDIQDEVSKSLPEEVKQEVARIESESKGKTTDNLTEASRYRSLLKEQELKTQSLEKEIELLQEKTKDYEQLKAAVAKQTFVKASDADPHLAEKVKQLESDIRTIIQERDDYEKQYKEAIARIEEFQKLDGNIRMVEFVPTRDHFYKIGAAAQRNAAIRISESRNGEIRLEVISNK